MKVRTVKGILKAFEGLEIPGELDKHFKAEVSTLRRQEELNRGTIPLNNQTYASVNNLRKVLKKCRKKD